MEAFERDDGDGENMVVMGSWLLCLLVVSRLASSECGCWIA